MGERGEIGVQGTDGVSDAQGRRRYGGCGGLLELETLGKEERDGCRGQMALAM